MDLLEHFQLNGEWQIVQSKVLQGFSQSHKYDDEFGYSWVRPHNYLSHIDSGKESRTALTCFYRTSGRFLLMSVNLANPHSQNPAYSGLIHALLHRSMSTCGLALMPLVIRKDHWQMLIESAQHSWIKKKT